MIQVQITFKDGHAHLVRAPTPRKIAARVERFMWDYTHQISNVNVIAIEEEAAAEGARLRHLFQQVNLDIRISQSMERLGVAEFDLYEIANYPRRRRVE